MSTTGGLLNKVCSTFGCTSVKKTVPIMALIKEHNPRTATELEELIENHQNYCSCGCKSNGTIKDFAKDLYEAWLKYADKHQMTSNQFSFDDCLKFIRCLFIENSLKGNRLEEKSIEFLKNINGNVEIHRASADEDANFGIDLIIVRGESKFGVQIKPISYKFVESSIKQMNIKKHKKYHSPILYVYYNEEEQFEIGEWANLPY